MKVPRLQPDGSLELKMTPLIDVVFLLLVFFVWTSSFEVPEFDLPSAIAETPKGAAEAADQTPEVEPFDEIVLQLFRIDARLIVEMNGQPVADLASLNRQLSEIIAIGVQPPVIIDPAAEITMNEAVKVYDVARTAGADRVLFAARANES